MKAPKIETKIDFEDATDIFISKKMNKFFSSGMISQEVKSITLNDNFNAILEQHSNKYLVRNMNK